MAFKPLNKNKPKENFESFNMPVPRAGSRKARVSLIVDLGIQPREDFVDEDTKEVREQKPCQQVAIFADLVADNVDYGGTIGKQQYRLMLNHSSKGELKGINFTTTPAKDAKGKIVKDKPWTFHPASLLTKLAKATGVPEICVDDNKPHSLDIEKLLNLPFMAAVEVNIVDNKNGEKDKDGNVIQYKYVNFRGASSLPTEDDGTPMEIPALKAKPIIITFDNVTPETAKFLRKNLIEVIKKATNYPGSVMQKILEAANQSSSEDDEEEEEAAPAVEPAKKAAAKKAPPPPADDEDEDDQDEDSPF